MSGDWELDAVLLERWRSGDTGAGDEIYKRHAGAVIRFFRNKIPDEAEDLVQRTFMRVIEGRDRIRDGVALRAYILSTARYVLGERLRSAAAREVDLEVDSMASLVPGQAAVVGRRQEHRLLVKAIRYLPIKHQIALELFYWEGLKASEIAEVMGVSHSAMRSRLARARALLLERIAELGESAKLIESTVSGLDRWAEQLRGQFGKRDEP